MYTNCSHLMCCKQTSIPVPPRFCTLCTFLEEEYQSGLQIPIGTVQVIGLILPIKGQNCAQRLLRSLSDYNLCFRAAQCISPPICRVFGFLTYKKTCKCAVRFYDFEKFIIFMEKVEPSGAVHESPVTSDIDGLQ